MLTSRENNNPKPVSIGIVGCGAIFELYYTPAFLSLAEQGVTLTHLIDPNATRLEEFKSSFPQAKGYTSLENALASPPDGLIVASPSGLHEEHAKAVIKAGAGVFIEKPMAHQLASGQRITKLAEEAEATAGVAMFRRFWPALRWIKDTIDSKAFGPLLSIDHQEGGPFNWPAASTSFFEPRKAGGGVLLDIGVHVLDTLVWWLGEPEIKEYWDDADGGLDANCRLKLNWSSSASAEIFLSRDWKTRNQMTLKFEKATVIWDAGVVDKIRLQPKGTEYWLQAKLEEKRNNTYTPADSYQQSFTRQLVSFIDTLRGERQVEVTPHEALTTLSLIDTCYTTLRKN
jgi:predicted dehydrogenase